MVLKVNIQEEWQEEEEVGKVLMEQQVLEHIGW